MTFIAMVLLIAVNSGVYQKYGVTVAVPAAFVQQSETTTPYGRAVLFMTQTSGSQMPQMISIEMIAPRHRTLAQFVKDFFAGNNAPVGVTARDVKRSQPEKICDGKQPARYLELQDAHSHGDMVLTITNKVAVVATYMRATDEAEDVQARHALESLCAQ